MTHLSTHPHSAPPPGRAGGKRAAAAIAAGAALACLLGSATPAVAADATFTSARDIALGPGAFPRELAIGDFNSDGRQDLAIADASRDRVYSRLGNGDGTFRDGGEVVGLGAPADVVVADFDADGNEDLAVAAYSAGRAVSLLRGLGDGRFTLGSGFRLPGGEPATSLAVGDFDGDAQADLAATTTAGVYVRLGEGTFHRGEDVPIRNPYGAVAAGDFDGDGQQDLAVTLNEGPSKIGVLRGRGDGGLDPIKTVAVPTAVELAVGDFNGDAKDDVVAPAVASDRVSVRLGNGDGTLSDDAPDVAVGNQPYGVAVGDFDSDGREDIVISHTQEGDSVSVRLGNGDGTFRDGGSVRVGARPLAPVVGDLNADGKQDLAIASYLGAAVNVRLGSGQPPLAGNLLVNGGFEQGLPARMPSQSPAIPGWSTTGGMTFARYGAYPHRGFPSWLDSPRYQTGGSNLLWGGVGSATTATQTVDVARSADPIDGGRATANLSAYLGGGLTDTGHMSATAEFLAASGTRVGSLTIGPVTAAQRRNVTTLLRRAGSAPVPAGTRAIRVTLTSTDADAVSSALADNVKLTLDTRQADNPPVGGGPDADRDAPVIGRVTLTPARFAVARRTTAITAAARGTTIRYTLSEPASVALRIQRAVAGRRLGGRCRAVTKRSRSGQPCRRYVAVATLRRTGREGTNRVAFSGRIGRRALARGAYRLVVSAVDAADNRSTARPRRFRIVR